MSAAATGQKFPWSKWPKIDPATVAPLRNGKPDMYNYRASRVVPKIEAEGRGWPLFWTGEECVDGHRAARYVSNTSVCSDCQRVKKGKVPVYGGGNPALEEVRRRAYVSKKTSALVRAPEPTNREKLFLQKYAETKSFSRAADECDGDEAEFIAILSWNEVFREAVNRLEDTLGVAHTQEVTEFFDWDEAKTRVFMLTYANSADMKRSLRSVGATNVQFHRELAQNPDFQRAFDDAAQVARAVFDHAASETAIKGDSKMLGRIAANMFPEKFGENLKIDMNVKNNLTLDQSHDQIAKLLSRFNRQGLLSAPEGGDAAPQDAEFEELEFSGVEETDSDPERSSDDPGQDPNSDLVSGSD